MRVLLNTKFTLCLLTVLCFCGTTASANVSLYNGNFFIGYTDLLYTGGFEPKIERVYNSKTSFKGIFGWGWGSEFEAYLDFMPDGSIVAHSYGGGRTQFFYPTGFDENLSKSGVEVLVKIAQDIREIRNESAAETYRQKLLTDKYFFLDEYTRFRKKGLLHIKHSPIGTSYPTGYGDQFVRIRDGYLYQGNQGQSEIYNLEGQLVKRGDKNGNYVVFEQDENGRIKSLTDNFGRKITFSFNTRGLLDSAVDDNNKKAVYRYDERDNLIYSKDVDGNEYEHEYDRSYNMTRIRYSDKTTLDISYYGRDQLQNVRSVKERDGKIINYSYKRENKSSEYRIIAVDVEERLGSDVKQNRYEYHEQLTKRGWLAKKNVYVLNGEREETEYDVEVFMPVAYKRGEKEFRFFYDENYNFSRVEGFDETFEAQYDKLTGKPQFVKHTSKSNPPKTLWAKYSYDMAGNLISAEDSLSRKFLFEYDKSGRLLALTDRENTRVELLEFNQCALPAKIRLTNGKTILETGISYEMEKNATTGAQTVYCKEFKGYDRQERKTPLVNPEILFRQLNEVITIADIKTGFCNDCLSPVKKIGIVDFIKYLFSDNSSKEKKAENK